MAYSFKNILIPVDLTINTELAVKKALELADTDSNIHLLYVQNNFTSRLILPKKSERYGDPSILNVKLEQWKSSIEESNNHIPVCIWNVMEESIQTAIEKKAKQLSIDLIIIGKSSHHSWFPFLNTVVPSNIVFKTGVSVLTVKPGSFHKKIKRIIVPVDQDITWHKIEVLNILSRKFFFQIHLVTFIKDENEPSHPYKSSLWQTYQLLRATITCPIELTVLSGHNKAKAILKYADDINADILLLHPETETKIGWMNKHISDVLLPGSKIQVFTIIPKEC